MPHTGADGELNPLVQPHAIRALRSRERLVDFGVRREVLEQLEERVAQRRTADTVASKVAHIITGSVKDSTEPVVRDRARNRLSEVNESRLDKI